MSDSTCPICKGTGFVDCQSGHSVNPGTTNDGVDVDKCACQNLIKSCFTCAYWKDESTPQTYWEPANNDWSCGHPDTDNFPYEEPEDGILTDNDKFAEYCAKDCPGYEYKDWPDYYKQQAIAEAQAEAIMAKHEAALEKYRTTYKEFGIEVDY